MQVHNVAPQHLPDSLVDNDVAVGDGFNRLEKHPQTFRPLDIPVFVFGSCFKRQFEKLITIN
jgi:hypothetical protein